MMSAFLWAMWTAAWAVDNSNADAAFDAVMEQNDVTRAPSSARAAPESLGYSSGDGEVSAGRPPVSPPSVLDGEVVVPLSRFEEVWDAIQAAEEEAAQTYTSRVVLGAATWTGRSAPGGLQLHLKQSTTLRGPGFWKAVPLVGEEVAVVRAMVNGAPIALTNQNGYQVWVTDTVGEVTLDLDVVVPARGPRGSMEYDFLVARTPVTRVDCLFPEEGLEPRLEQTVRAEMTREGVGTRLSAWLEPTSRIHLVGFRDLGDTEDQTARRYVETVSLLSLDERSADLFSVLKYTILQGGSREFDIRVPSGLTVVSADGAGAFRYTVETVADGMVLHGQTAFPVKDNYEVSLRLSRTWESGVPLEVIPPVAMGVEREHGWLGVEVLGPVQLDEGPRKDALTVDVAQLPAELVGNAVSPVLKGWRYHAASPVVGLIATRLPERAPAAGSVDAMRAVATVSAEGRARMDVQIALRNRLRHSLRLRLPEGMVIRSSSIDGAAVTPSIDADGAVLLPLKRSLGGDRPRPFTLSLGLEGDVGALGVVGIREMELPRVELPVAVASLEVRMPAAWRYTRLFGDVAEQEGLWASEEGGHSVLRYARSWVGADRPVQVWFGAIRGWLMAPFGLLAMGAAVAVGLWGLRHAPSVGLRGRVAGVAAALGAIWSLESLLGMGGAAGVLLGVAFGAGGFGRARAWVRGLAMDVEPTEPAPGSWRAKGAAERLGMAVATLLVAGFSLIVGLTVLWIALNPAG